MLQIKGGIQLIAAGLLAWGCGIAGAESDLFVVTTADFETGSTSFVTGGAARVEVDVFAPIHGDAVARYHDGVVYVIERFLGDNIIVLNAADLATPVVQFSVGNGANPQDIELANPAKAYVSRYGSAQLLIVDPRDGTELGQIDLSGFADDDGLPEMGQMATVGSRLYVACQRLENFAPTGASYLVVIDMDTDSFVDIDPGAEGVQAISLAATNPNTVIAIGESIVVSGVASFGDVAGGIEIIDLDTNQSRGVAISEEALGGDVTALAMVSESRGYAIVLDDGFAYHVRPVDLESGAIGEDLEGHSGGFTPALAVDGARLIVADRGPFDDPDRAGLLIYDAHSNALLQGPISTGLPPADIVVMSGESASTAVLEEAVQVLPQQLSLGAAYPNPFNAETLIPFEIEASNRAVRLVVRDALGRQIRALINGPLSAGHHAFSWDGRNDAGEAVSSGAYLAELRLGARRTTGKLMLLK